MNSLKKVQLGYWKIRGLGEKVRMILEYVGIPYEEIKYGNDQEDKWFNEDKPKLLNQNPAINLPYLIDGNQVISESDAIIVYLCYKGNRVDLLGTNCE
jgi:glutathione S-transferase